MSPGFRPLAGEPDPNGPTVPRGEIPYELDLTGFHSEAALANAVLSRLNTSFTIRRECPGTHCSGRQMRIDAVIQARDSTAWKDDVVAFGLEFKLPGRDAGIKAYTKWIAQAVDYTHVEWDGFGRLPILTCPGPAAWLDRLQQHPPEDPLAGLARRLTGQLGLGEVQLRWNHGLTITMNGEQLWSERYGVRRGRTWSTKLRVGSR